MIVSSDFLGLKFMKNKANKAHELLGKSVRPTFAMTANRIITVLRLCILISSLIAGGAFAGGSICFEEVEKKIQSTSPKIIATASAAFDMDRVGGALRLGARSLEVQNGTGEVGQRVPPFTFLCRAKGTKTDFDLVITFDEAESGWTFTVRNRTKHD